MQDLADSVSDMSKANDWFLVAPDFTEYMRAQVRFPLRTQSSCSQALLTLKYQPAAQLNSSASQTSSSGSDETHVGSKVHF